MALRPVIVLLLCLVIALTTVAPARAQNTAGGAVEAEIPTAPVEFDGNVLLHVRGVSSLPAAERAQLISKRLTEVAADNRIPVDALHVVEEQGASRIMAADHPVMTVV